MRALYAAMIMSVALAFMISTAASQYWFQTGAVGTYNASRNIGAAVTIETVYQNITSGSLGFWVGETLSNGAFAQVGYEIENQSGFYPNNCDISGCNGSVYIAAGTPTWFWEYFPQDYNGSAFLGGIGANGSAGPSGSFNTYSMNSSGNVWNFYFNGNKIGSVDLGASTSGANPPTAIGEIAATDTNGQYMSPVIFENLRYYYYDGSTQVPVAYSTISYGKGSESLLPNPYGIEEVGTHTNMFEVGSGIPLNNQTKLWSLGYTLKIVSDYGNISSEYNYSGSSLDHIGAPAYVYINGTAREKFLGWVGQGDGSYTGSLNSTEVLMLGNITETAQWQRQYYVNVSSVYGSASGGRWYDRGAMLSMTEYPSVLSMGEGVRELFSGWNSSTGYINDTAPISVVAPMNISAVWNRQYLVNVTSAHGTVSGNGWYDNGSADSVSVSNYTDYISNSSRISFREWSNGSTAVNFTTVVSGPIMLAAEFGTQYAVNFAPHDAYGNLISSDYVDVSGIELPQAGAFMFPGAYEINYIRYKGTNVAVGKNISVSGPYSVQFTVPVYNVNVTTASLFGGRVNASASLTFENGTTFNGYLGPDGSVSFTDVPYGYLSGYVYYKNMVHQVSAGYGSSASTLFIDPVTFAPVLAAIIIAIAVAVHTYRSRKLRRYR